MLTYRLLPLIAVFLSQSAYGGLRIVDRVSSLRFIEVEARGEDRIAFHLCDTFDGAEERNCDPLADRESYSRDALVALAEDYRSDRRLYLARAVFFGVLSALAANTFPKLIRDFQYREMGKMGLDDERAKRCSKILGRMFYGAFAVAGGSLIFGETYVAQNAAEVEEGLGKVPFVDTGGYERWEVDGLGDYIRMLRRALNRATGVQ